MPIQALVLDVNNRLVGHEVVEGEPQPGALPQFGGIDRQQVPVAAVQAQAGDVGAGLARKAGPGPEKD